MAYAKLDTAKLFLVGPILDADGVAVTGALTATDVLKVTKNGTVGAADAQDTMAHSHTGHYVVTTDGGDFDTLGEVTFSLNSGTNAMAPVTFSVLPALTHSTMAAASGGNLPQVVAGGAGGAFIAGTNAQTTITTSLIVGAITLTTPIESDITKIHGTAITETAGQLAGAFTKFFDVAAPTATCLSLPDAVPGASTGLLISGSNTGTTTLGALTVTNATTLSGAVSLGSTLGVTGAVTLSSTLNTGAVTLASAAVTGALSVGTTTTLTGAVSLGSTLGVTGAATFASLAVTGALSVGTTTTFTGAVSAPAGITADITGNISGSVGSVTTKTGFILAATGLDTVAITAPTNVASNFREMQVQVWRRFFKKATKTDTAIKTFNDDGITATTNQTVSDDGTTETQGAASAP